LRRKRHSTATPEQERLTLVQRLLEQLNNNRILAPLIAAGIVCGSLVTFSENARKVWKEAFSPKSHIPCIVVRMAAYRYTDPIPPRFLGQSIVLDASVLMYFDSDVGSPIRCLNVSTPISYDLAKPVASQLRNTWIELPPRPAETLFEGAGISATHHALTFVPAGHITHYGISEPLSFVTDLAYPSPRLSIDEKDGELVIRDDKGAVVSVSNGHHLVLEPFAEYHYWNGREQVQVGKLYLRLDISLAPSH
jgi:hypothetical protein